MDQSIKVKHREFKRAGQRSRTEEAQVLRILEKLEREFQKAEDYQYPLLKRIVHKRLYSAITMDS